MCGVPYHAAENYIARLIRAGHKVAICEQMEVPGPGKKIVRREVIRVLTPGTASGAGLVEAKENNFLAAVARSCGGSAPQVPAPADGGARRARGTEPRLDWRSWIFLPGEFRATEFSGEKAEARLRDELGILRPREVLLAQPVTLFPVTVPAEMDGLGAVETRLDDWVFETNYATRTARRTFSRGGARRFWVERASAGHGCGRGAGALFARDVGDRRAEAGGFGGRFRRCVRRGRGSSIWIASRITSSRTR